MATPTTAPIAIPAITPVDRLALLVGGGLVVDVGVDAVEAIVVVVGGVVIAVVYGVQSQSTIRNFFIFVSLA